MKETKVTFEISFATNENTNGIKEQIESRLDDMLEVDFVDDDLIESFEIKEIKNIQN